MRDALLFERAASSSRFLDGDTAPGGGHVPEHCPISILQAHGGGAIPGFAFGRLNVLSPLRSDQPWTYPVEDTRIRVTTDICFLRYCRLLTLYFGDGHVLLPRRRSDDGASGTRPGRHPLCLSLGR